MMSMHSSTHSSQMNTVGPAMSLRTSCWLLPQNEQYSVLLESPLPTLLMANLHSIESRTAAARLIRSGYGAQGEETVVPTPVAPRDRSPSDTETMTDSG